MRNSKTFVVAAFLLSLIAIATFGFAFAPEESNPPEPEAPNLQAEGVKAPPTDIPGWKFKGKYIKVGINKLGTLGVGEKGVDPGVGFQFPIGPAYESLAIWWWGEGFKISYKVGNQQKIAYWTPSYGYPPPAHCNLILSKNTVWNDTQKAMVRSEVYTRDWLLKLTFEWTFLKNYPHVVLETTIENNYYREITEVVYTRIVDWDVHQNTGSNRWFSDAHSAWAKWHNPELGRWYVCGVAGYPQVEDIDLWAWDDTNKPHLGNLVVKSFEIIKGDYNAGLYYQIARELCPDGSVTVKTVYMAGTS